VGPEPGSPPPTLLCVANFPANTGFAWDFIEGLYARCADALASRGVRTFVAYPRIDSPPRSLVASAAQPVELDALTERLPRLLRLMRWVRRENVRAIYFTDRLSRSWGYAWLRLAGVRWIVVHDHTSGKRRVPRGLRRMLKRLFSLLPGVTADHVIAVSDYVATRQREVALMPADRVTRIWNGLPVPDPVESRPDVRRRIGLPLDRPVIVCACRATPEKGVHHLLRAFDQVHGSDHRAAPLLVYVGDGPHQKELEKVRAGLARREHVMFAGYRTDVPDYLWAADICVAPSVWEDALPLGVLEPMALGRPVIASRVGGVPEMCRHEQEGLLVAPGDEPALAAALARLLDAPALSERLGQQGRARAREHFAPESQINGLLAALEPGLIR